MVYSPGLGIEEVNKNRIPVIEGRESQHNNTGIRQQERIRPGSGWRHGFRSRAFLLLNPMFKNKTKHHNLQKSLKIKTKQKPLCCFTSLGFPRALFSQTPLTWRSFLIIILNCQAVAVRKRDRKVEGMAGNHLSSIHPSDFKISLRLCPKDVLNLKLSSVKGISNLSSHLSQKPGCHPWISLFTFTSTLSPVDSIS